MGTFYLLVTYYTNILDEDKFGKIYIIYMIEENNKYGGIEMKGRFIKRASKAGAGNVKQGNVKVTSLGQVFNRGIDQKGAYDRIENELTTWEIKRSLYKFGMKIYEELNDVNEMLETGKELTFNELTELFSILESKERKVSRFEEYETYVRNNITEIKTEKDLRNLQKLFKLR